MHAQFTPTRDAIVTLYIKIFGLGIGRQRPGIVGPRREFYHTSEGSADRCRPEVGPDLSTLRDTRLTIPGLGKSVKDGWRTTAMKDGSNGDG